MSEPVPCFIPARLGSKRVPRKNLRPMAGKPMLDYTIEAALACRTAGPVFVCTEAGEVADAAARHQDVEPRLVPAELCGDSIPSWRPCAHVAHELQREGRAVESLVCLQPTSPLRSPEDIDRGVDCFSSSGADFVVSVTQIDPHYFHWALSDDDGRWEMIFRDDYLAEGASVPPRYRPNGSIKIAKLKTLETTGHFFGQPLACFETPEERSVHVGGETEFRFAELLLSERSAR